MGFNSGFKGLTASTPSPTSNPDWISFDLLSYNSASATHPGSRFEREGPANLIGWPPMHALHCTDNTLWA